MDRTLRREVAFALIAGGGPRGSSRERVLDEVRTTARLEHPHIVTVYDVRDTADATIVVSRLVRGGSAADWAARATPGARRVQTAVEIARQVASALAHAHADGVIHRDVKPSNILLAPDGTALLADFGVALLAGSATDAGGAVGSLAYMPPEQAAGAAVDARSDLYALGATLFELACGTRPFADATADAIRRRSGPPPDPRAREAAVPAELAELIVWMLAPAPEGRPPSAAAVEAELARLATPVATGHGAATAFPAALAGAADRPFVGRQAALEDLRAAWRRTGPGAPGLALVSGEAGIGKTTLAAAFARERRRDGALVLHGRCDDDPLISYQPFVEALRQLVTHQPELEHALDPRLEPELAELGNLVPELRRSTSGPGGEAQRYLLFDAVVALFAAGSARQSLLVVLDDLQWAPRPTMLLLRHVLRAAAPGGILVLATVRTDDGAGEDPLAGLRADLRRRHGQVDSIALGGLDAIETGALVSVRRDDAGDGFVRALHDTTAGNPFFIEETLRHLRDSDLSARSLSALGVPDGAKEVIQRRLDGLPEETRELLGAAAVCGREFRLDVLAELRGEPIAQLVVPLEKAMDAGLIVEPAIGRFTYCHALVRETLYAAIASDTSRARMHLAVAEALEALDGDGAQPSELALHFHAGRHLGGADKAVRYGLEAADAAAAALAYEEAARHKRQVLDALELLSPARDQQRFQELDKLGRLQWQAGDSAAAKETFREKAALARRADEAEQLARAALGFGGRWYDAEHVDDELIALLREARSKLPQRPGATRAKVLAHLAQAVRPADRDGEARALNAEALEMARRTGDREALIDALSGEHTALHHVGRLPERLAVGTEWLELAGDGDHPDALALALCWRAFDLFEAGDLEGSRAAQARLAELAERLRQPLYRTFATSWEFKWLGAGGRFADAERMARDCHRYARQAHASYANSQYAGQIFSLLRDGGAVAEAQALVERYLAGEATLSAWRAGIVLARAAAGDADEARAELAQLCTDGFASIETDVFWLPAMCMLAEAAMVVGDARAGEALATALAPHADRNAQIGFAVILGPVQLFAAMAAAAAGRGDEAESRFREAIERSAALGTVTAEVHARCAYGELLRASADDRAGGELEQALSMAERLGMAGCARRAAKALGNAG